jgi:predicted nucleotidyltransferase
MGSIGEKISLDHERLAAFCRKRGIRRMAFFGSVLRDDFGPDSDVDVLVEFDPTKVPGLMGLAGMELEMGSLLGRKVDLRTPADLSRNFRDRVVASAVDEYVQSR